MGKRRRRYIWNCSFLFPATTIPLFLYVEDRKREERERELEWNWHQRRRMRREENVETRPKKTFFTIVEPPPLISNVSNTVPYLWQRQMFLFPSQTMVLCFWRFFKRIILGWESGDLGGFTPFPPPATAKPHPNCERGESKSVRNWSHYQIRIRRRRTNWSLSFNPINLFVYIYVNFSAKKYT